MKIIETDKYKVKLENIADYIAQDKKGVANKFLKELNIELDKWDGIKVDETFRTSNPKIYAGGDSVRGADLAVTAAADGRDVALAIVQNFR